MKRLFGSPVHLSRRAALLPPCLLALGLLGARLSAASERLERPIGPGVRLLQWTSPSGPNQLSAVEVDAANPFIRLGVSFGGGDTLSLVPLSRQAERLTRPDRYPIAGVNGDYFFYPNAAQPGIPTNATVVDGEVIRTPFPRSCLILRADGAPSIQILKASARVTYPGGATANITGVNQPRAAGQLVLYTPRYGSTTRTAADGAEALLEPEQFALRHSAAQRARVRSIQPGGASAIPAGSWILSGSGAAAAAIRALHPDDAVEVRVDFDPTLAPGDEVLGGGPRIVRDGKASVEMEGGTLGDTFARALHPRTAVGFNGRKLYLLAVDGRQPGYSAGIGLQDLAQAMIELGCTDAMNLDGGGSTTLWARGEVVNRPSDGRERAVANGLLVFSTAPKGDPVRLRLAPNEIFALAGAELPLKVSAEDQYYNPVPAPANLAWSAADQLGTVRGNVFVASVSPNVPPGADAAEGMVSAAAGGIHGEVRARVYPRPARVEVLPAMARVGTLTRTPLRVRAYDAAGHLLALPASVNWSATPGLGTMDAGTFAAGERAQRGVITASVNGVSGSAQVEVAEVASRALEDFEGGAGWTQRLTPAGLPASVSVAEGPAHSGKRALRIQYDFSTAPGTRAVYALAEKPLGRPFALKAWVYGDGQGAWLRARIRDAKGETHLLDLARHVDWNGSWREVRAGVSDDFPTPLTLEAVYVVETEAARKPKGMLLIDDISVEQ